jgi:hypothetical protein
MAKWEKMSKSRGNVITPDEIVYGVYEVNPGYEFRDESGKVIEDFRELGIWRDRPNGGDFFTSSRFGKRPVFLHEIGNPDPCQFTDGKGNVREQHPDLKFVAYYVPDLPKTEGENRDGNL